MKIFIYALIMFMVFSSGTCLREDFYPIIIRNESDKPFYFFSADELAQTQYPDTTLYEQKPVLVKVDVEKGFNIYSRKKWEEILPLLPMDTLSIYFFNDQIVENTEWSVIRENYMILKRYDLSIQDLQQLDFKVPYPPITEMANMKMFPPY